MAFTNFDKAIAGGVTSALVGELARFGFHPQATTISAVGVILTAVVGYAIGHLAVYFKNNKVVSDAEAAVSAVEQVTSELDSPAPEAPPKG